MYGQDTASGIATQQFQQVSGQTATQAGPNTVDGALLRLSHLLDRTRDVASQVGMLADRLGGPMPTLDGKASQTREPVGSVGALHAICDQLEAALNSSVGNVQRALQAHG